MQITQWPGEWWEIDASYRLFKTRADAEAIITFLLACRGISGTFLAGPEKLARTAQGTASGVTVNGAGQSGTTLNLSGSGTIKAGDYLQLGSGASSRLHKFLQDAGSVAATHEIWPRLRESPSAGSSVVLSNPKGVFRLSAANQTEWNVDLVQMYGISFKAMEAI